MVSTVLAHVLSLVTSWIVEWIVTLLFAPVNLFLAGLSSMLGSFLLLKAGVSLERVERANASNIAGWMFVSGAIAGFALILTSLLVFRYFQREPGLPMLSIFIILQLVPIPRQFSEPTRRNMRSSSIGVVAGLLIGWWLAYPK